MVPLVRVPLVMMLPLGMVVGGDGVGGPLGMVSLSGVEGPSSFLLL